MPFGRRVSILSNFDRELQNMNWIVYCTDMPGAHELREANTPKHRAYLETRPIVLVTSGPLVDDAGEKKIGSFFLVEAQTREEVEAFNRNDPFFALGLWDEVRIHRFHRRVG
ncbi:hypothetical protein B0G76_2169 [Paraburkholderia sp. BL23I1N1]|nr:hypothetical protein B0G76_2169 [Paraburkholderia sp. BL23I1N1]